MKAISFIAIIALAIGAAQADTTGTYATLIQDGVTVETTLPEFSNDNVPVFGPGQGTCVGPACGPCLGPVCTPSQEPVEIRLILDPVEFCAPYVQ